MQRDFHREQELIFKSIVIPFFKEKGFKRRGNGFNKSINDVIQVINLQKSNWNHKDSVSFTFNVGFFNADIYQQSWNKQIPRFIREYDCQLQFRLGQVVKNFDYWYELNDTVTINELSNEIKGDLNEYLLPLLDKIQSVKTLVSLFSNNHVVTGKLDQVLLLLKVGYRQEAESLLKEEYENSMYPKEVTSVTIYPDGRREEKVSRPSINTEYIKRLKDVANALGIRLD